MSSEISKTLLQKIHIFAGLEDATLDALSALCRPLDVAAGQFIVRERVLSREMYVIASGKVRVVQNETSPDPVILAEFGAGEFFGEMSVIECVPRSASVYAIEPSVVYSLSSGDIHQLFKRWPDQCAILMLNIARDLCRRLRRMDERFAATAH